MESVAFKISSLDALDSARVFGHRLSRYNPSYSGSEFISPLALSWPGATEPTPILDSEMHGYHGEMESSAKLRGVGPPEPFQCPGCGGDLFRVRVQFDYGEACLDILEDEPDVAVQDYFENIMVDGECTRCEQTSRILDMDL